MSDCRLIVGSDQFVEFELECETQDYVLDPDDWTVTCALLEINGTWDEDTAMWATAALIVGPPICGQALLSGLLDPVVAGTYHVLVQAVPTGAALENPRFIATGHVVITDPLGLTVVEEPTP